MGATFVAEEWPERRRRAGAGYMHTGYYVGIFLAAIANYAIGSRFGDNGWRVMFAVGGLPAVVLAWVSSFFDMLVDGIVDLVGVLPRWLGAALRPIQNGLVQFYALAMILGLTVFLLALVRSL